MKLNKELDELIKERIISNEIAENIRNYYRYKKNTANNKLLLIFSILGAILIGLGIILIIAHNWDNFSKSTKTVFAFIPLVIGQILAGYSLYKKRENKSWTEGSSTLLFFAIGANISMISQIYNLHGDLSTFIITWMLIFLPIVYLMNSSTGSLFFIVGITTYACETGYWTIPANSTHYYWISLLFILPHYYMLLKKNPESNFTILHNWLIPASILISLGTISRHYEEFLFLTYISLFGLFNSLSKTKISSKRSIDGYSFFSSIGSIILLLILSFDWYWEELRTKEYILSSVLQSSEIITSFLIVVISIAVRILFKRKDLENELDPLEYAYLFFTLIFVIGFYSNITAVLINILVFIIGVLIILRGAITFNLGTLNYGLITITSLIACRFFDSDLSFITRGLLFIIVGSGFFISNYLILKKKKLAER